MRLRALDARDRLRGRADRYLPPRRLTLAARSDFAETGDEYLSHFIELGDLQPDHRVLDVGSGMGKLARPLAGYLSGDGSYDGFDADREAIGWCRRRYRRLPNFAFKVADVQHPRFNPLGARFISEYRFPYDDDSFDFVICASVLTHVLEHECEHLLSEIARVVAPGGQVFATFFLLNDTSRAMIEAGQAGLPFLDPSGRIAIVDETRPEEAVAYDDEWVFETLRGEGLELAAIHPGSWSGREEYVSFQDIVIADA